MEQEKRQAYIEKYSAAIERWEADLKKLKADAAGASADIKIEYEKRIENLRSKTAEQRRKLNELRHAGEDAWDEMRKGFEAAWDDLRTAWESAAAKVT